MLHSLKAVDGFPIMTPDGLIGKVKDLYFDDFRWAIRYLEVDTGGWLSGRRVLISPSSIVGIDWDREEVMVRLSRKQVEESPGIETAATVSRQQEAALASHYGYPHYWAGPYIWGYTAFPMMMEPATTGPAAAQNPEEPPQSALRHSDPHLRSKDEVIGYNIEASDDEIGHVDDFLFDDENWAISHMVIDTRKWWPGRRVLVSPTRISGVSWEGKRVSINLSREEVEQSAAYDEAHSPAARYDEVYRHASGFSEMPPFTPADAIERHRNRKL